jgi:signal peptidase I
MLRSKLKEELKSWLITLFIAFGVVMIVRTFLFAPYIVEGASMEPTLHNSEKIFVNKISSSNSIQRGDIIIIEGPVDSYVKRVIGLPGDKIKMENDQLFINNKPFNEDYLSFNREVAKKMGTNLTGDFGPVTVPKNQFFVMGDNRLVSMDSRNGLGLISKEDIVGKSEFVFYPFSEIRSVE